MPDLAPVSPIYSDSEGTAQSEVVANTSWDINPPPQKTLPPDQLKFLKFAGNFLLFLYSRKEIYKRKILLLSEKKNFFLDIFFKIEYQENK